MDKKTNDNIERRSFLRTLFALGAGVSILTPNFGKSSGTKVEKTKFLTPDGRLVEIANNKIEREVISDRASNEDVLKWMNKD